LESLGSNIFTVLENIITVYNKFETRDYKTMKVTTKIMPPLDSGFCPASIWEKHYLDRAKSNKNSREATFRVERPDGKGWNYHTLFLPNECCYKGLNWKRAERNCKFLLWAWGGSRIYIEGVPEIILPLRNEYSAKGKRAFDAEFMGTTCFLEPMTVTKDLPHSTNDHLDEGASFGRHLEGCRIGFDLGGSDRKSAAVIDGEVLFSEEIKWNPYFVKDPSYHREGIQDSLRRAASHLPRVDAIGGSAAGIYVKNEVRAGSLYRGISPEDFDQSIRKLFLELGEEWGNVPFTVANDGDVTALAASIALEKDAILGIAMGTSQAAGYIDGQGHITGYLNELAFAPIDYREDAPMDEWSGDVGCGAQYFSQQAVGRLLPVSGLEAKKNLPLPEKLEYVQEKMNQGDDRAADIFCTIGIYYGYSLAHYASFYPFQNVLTLGRVTSGEGGEIIQREAKKVLDVEFPELSPRISFLVPDEKMKRHGQAIAAASLPETLA